jgi:hypothetical protein
MTDTTRLVVRLAVSEVFKGAAASSIEVATAATSSACGFRFQEGRGYLVFAYLDPSRRAVPALSTSKCGHTSAVEEAGEALRYLRARVAAREPPGIIHGVVRSLQRASAHAPTWPR